MRCARCGNRNDAGQPCLCRQLTALPPLWDNLAPAIAPAAVDTADWQQEVRERLRQYQTRRGRAPLQKDLEFSPPAPQNLLRFPAAGPKTTPAARPALAPPVAALDPGTTVLADFEIAAAPAAMPEPEFEPAIAWQTAPAPLAAPACDAPEPEMQMEAATAAAPAQSAAALGEPCARTVVERRCLTPLPAGPDWAPIAIAARAPAALAPTLRLPLPPAPARVRLRAALADAGIVLAACLAWAGIAGLCLGWPRVGSLRPAVGFAAAACLLWAAIYIVLSLSLCGATLGMRWQGLLLQDFSGRPASPGRRRRRGWLMLFSLLALGFGFWWMFFDDDHLAWHDYWTASYPVLPVSSDIFSARPRAARAKVCIGSHP